MRQKYLITALGLSVAFTAQAAGEMAQSVTSTMRGAPTASSAPVEHTTPRGGYIQVTPSPTPTSGPPMREPSSGWYVADSAPPSPTPTANAVSELKAVGASSNVKQESAQVAAVDEPDCEADASCQKSAAKAVAMMIGCSTGGCYDGHDPVVMALKFDAIGAVAGTVDSGDARLLVAPVVLSEEPVRSALPPVRIEKERGANVEASTASLPEGTTEGKSRTDIKQDIKQQAEMWHQLPPLPPLPATTSSVANPNLSEQQTAKVSPHLESHTPTAVPISSQEVIIRSSGNLYGVESQPSGKAKSTINANVDARRQNIQKVQQVHQTPGASTSGSPSSVSQTLPMHAR